MAEENDMCGSFQRNDKSLKMKSTFIDTCNKSFFFSLVSGMDGNSSMEPDITKGVKSALHAATPPGEAT